MSWSWITHSERLPTGAVAAYASDDAKTLIVTADRIILMVITPSYYSVLFHAVESSFAKGLIVLTSKPLFMGEHHGAAIIFIAYNRQHKRVFIFIGNTLTIVRSPADLLSGRLSSMGRRANSPPSRSLAVRRRVVQ
jgi:hypothetical protein